MGAASAIGKRYSRIFLSTDRNVVEQAVSFAADTLRATDVAAQSAESLTIAVLEAVGNVVRHAAKHACEFTVEVRRDGDHAVVAVVDHGPGFELRPAKMPDSFQECGRGVPLMQTLCDSVEYLAGADGNRLVLTKRIILGEMGS